MSWDEYLQLLNFDWTVNDGVYSLVWVCYKVSESICHGPYVHIREIEYVVG